MLLTTVLFSGQNLSTCAHMSEIGNKNKIPDQNCSNTSPEEKTPFQNLYPETWSNFWHSFWSIKIVTFLYILGSCFCLYQLLGINDWEEWHHSYTENMRKIHEGKKVFHSLESMGSHLPALWSSLNLIVKAFGVRDMDWHWIYITRNPPLTWADFNGEVSDNLSFQKGRAKALII